MRSKIYEPAYKSALELEKNLARCRSTCLRHGSSGQLDDTGKGIKKIIRLIVFTHNLQPRDEILITIITITNSGQYNTPSETNDFPPSNSIGSLSIKKLVQVVVSL